MLGFQASQPLRLQSLQIRAPQCEKTRTAMLTGFAKRASLPRPAVFFVTPDSFSKDVDKAISLTQAVLAGGAAAVQIRDCTGRTDEIMTVVHELLAAGTSARELVVNGLSPAEVASISPDLGVHIKEKNIAEYLPQVANSLSPSALVGCAVHSAEAAACTLELLRPVYFQVGTMFATTSHPGKVPEGPRLIRETRAVVGHGSALIGVGGINEENLRKVLAAGGDGVAVVTHIAEAADPGANTRALVTLSQQLCTVEKARSSQCGRARPATLEL